MIRLTTICVQSATRPSPQSWFCSSAALSWLWLNSICIAQDPSVLELVPREPPNQLANQEPVAPDDPVQAVPGRQASSFPLDPFGITPEADLLLPQEPSSELGGEELSAAVEGETEILPEPNASDENMDLLMRAPLHEAFAEIPLSSPLPNPVVARRPPATIEELPPDYKPEGDNVIWISGYWFWEEEREDYIWISGVWRDAPLGQQWIEGYWHEETGEQGGEVGFRWINGFWQSTEAVELNYLPQPPEPVEVGPSMPAPSEDYFYVPGSWIYQQTQYVWQPGYYSVYIEDLVWVPPTYVWTPCGYLFRPGYWDKPIEERGLVFAPVFFRQPIYLQPHYFYQPTCVIDTGLALLPHLFVRRNRSHYYFGDWYADRYVRRDFCGWSNLATNRHFQRRYDPLLNYYSSPVARRHNRSIAYWAGLQHRHCENNIGLRPPIVFNTAMVKQRYSGRNNFGQRPFDVQALPNRQVFLADNLERRAKSKSISSLDRNAHQLVRIDERQQKNELAAINRQLQKQRRDTERELAKSPRIANQPTQVRINPTALTTDPIRLARKEQELIRRQETQLKIRQKQTEAATRAQTKQAEVAARAQGRQMESDQQKQQRDLAGQLKAQNRQLNRDQRQTNSRGVDTPRLEGPRPQDGNLRSANSIQPNPSLTQQPRQQQLERAAERQLKTDQRKLSQQLNQQQLEQRRTLEATQRQTDVTQRQDASAFKRQQTDALRQSQDAARIQQRQMDAQQRQLETLQRQSPIQQRQNEPQRNAQIQQRQLEQQQRAAQIQQRQLEQQRQGQLQQQQLEQQRQGQIQQRQMEQQQRQSQVQQRQMEQQQRQAQEASQRQQAESRRAAERSVRDQQRQSEQQQRDSNRGRKKD